MSDFNWQEQVEKNRRDQEKREEAKRRDALDTPEAQTARARLLTDADKVSLEPLGQWYRLSQGDLYSEREFEKLKFTRWRLETGRLKR